MKTNPFARHLVNIRGTLVCLALAAILGFEFYVGESLAARIGQTTACQSDSPQPPSVSISDLMVAAR